MLFQSIGKKGRSFFIAALQSGCISIPCMLILPNLFGIAGIQMAQPCAYLIAGALTIPVLLLFFKQESKKIT
jgi:Na+-driven multidrug efflux pump